MGVYSVKHCLSVLASCSLIAAVPNPAERLRAQHPPSLEPRSNGVANIAAVHRAIEHQLARYTRSSDILSRRGSSQDQATVNGTSADAATIQRKYARERAKTKDRRETTANTGELQLVQSSTDPQDDGHYLGQVYAGGSRYPTYCRFDTLSVELVVPGKRCIAARGCLGGMQTLYSEDGLSLVSDRSTTLHDQLVSIGPASSNLVLE